MKPIFTLGLLLAVIAGCSKQEPPAAPAPVEPPAAESPAPAAAPTRSPSSVSPPPAVKPQAQPQPGLKPLEGQVDVRMTALLKKFVLEKRRIPESILELGGATSDGFPLAPAGYLYAIDPATTQVKLVKQ
jgi:hypothetical protein